MKKILTLLCAAALAIPAAAVSPNKIVIPDVEGYKTLKGDFHIHTVFSDANVWPTTRVHEAIWEGLDVIAITDHVDTRLQKNLANGIFNPEKVNRNTSYDIAKKAAGKDLIVIRGTEITRGMPPGHWNCLFTEDNNKICSAAEKYDNDNVKAMEAGLKEAHVQKAFTMWNHPHWEKQAPDTTIMWDAHKKLLKDGYMYGIEIVNEFCGYSPEAFQWALDNDLTVLGNSDCHAPFFMLEDYENGGHRPVTLVFAEEKNAESVREALNARRTAVFAYDHAYGREAQLRPLFDACVKVEKFKVTGSDMTFTLRNLSSIPVILEKGKGSEDVYYPREIRLAPFSYVNVKVRPLVKDDKATKFTPGQHIVANFKVANFLVGPDKPLTFKIEGTVPAAKK